MPNRTFVEKLGFLTDIEKSIPDIRGQVTRAFKEDGLDNTELEINGNHPNFYELWFDVLKRPAVKKEELNDLVIRMAKKSTILIGIGSKEGADQYREILGELSGGNEASIEVREVAVRSKEALGGEKVLLAAKRKR